MPEEKFPVLSAKNAVAVAFLEQKLKEEATDNSAEIRQSEEEFEELQRSLNANRDETGERRVFA